MQVDLGVSWLQSLSDPIQNVNVLRGMLVCTRELAFLARLFSVMHLSTEWHILRNVFTSSGRQVLDTHKVELLSDPALWSRRMRWLTYVAVMKRRTDIGRYQRSSIIIQQRASNKRNQTSTRDGSCFWEYMGRPRWFGGEIAIMVRIMNLRSRSGLECLRLASPFHLPWYTTQAGGDTLNKDAPPPAGFPRVLYR